MANSESITLRVRVKFLVLKILNILCKKRCELNIGLSLVLATCGVKKLLSVPIQPIKTLFKIWIELH